MKRDPILMRSGLTGNVYIVTSYKDLGEGQIEASQKYDVTEQFNGILETIKREQVVARRFEETP